MEKGLDMVGHYYLAKINIIPSCTNPIANFHPVEMLVHLMSRTGNTVYLMKMMLEIYLVDLVS